MRNRMYGGVRGRKTRVGEKLHRFPPTRLYYVIFNYFIAFFSLRRAIASWISYARGVATQSEE